MLFVTEFIIEKYLLKTFIYETFFPVADAFCPGCLQPFFCREKDLNLRLIYVVNTYCL